MSEWLIASTLKSYFLVWLISLLYFEIDAQPNLIDPNEIDTLIEEAWSLKNTDKAQSELLLNSALTILNTKNDKAKESTCYNILGIINRELGIYEKSDSLFQAALKIREQIGDSIGFANVLSNIGTLKLESGHYNESLSCFLAARDIYDRHNDNVGVASCYDNLANLMDNQREYEIAIEYNLKSMKFYEQVQDYHSLANSIYNLAERYFNLNKLNAAMKLLNQSINLYDEFEDWYGKAYSLTLLGNVFYEKKEFTKAEEYYNNAIVLYEEHQDTSNGLVNIYLNIAELKIEENDLETALVYLNKSKKFIKSSENLQDEWFLSSQYATVFSGMNMFDSAFIYKEISFNLWDSLYKTESSLQFAEMQTKYETERTQRELADEKLQSQKAKFQKNIFVGLFISAFAIALLVSIAGLKPRTLVR